ncbi:glycosyltransferase family 1 protein [Phormidesmis priestleyi ULC007]|uniref:Glycosyltransferase family 1 protein n=1 Tax=Phormidesmis priestleyi ULC007 TaxID=1920490 RepID=A0A2T1DIQ4_9CYAN|nr:glycosyltransferase [Phormidesmis priestleyi]PSB20345.1 glycosyltransferase family 1 protein [Phormidesmis priestleyi ULC007]PZO47049.1 MAG: glycosyltransferase family 1 protein [Phormidesmis priestleyi]
MKILFLNYSGKLGGAELSLLDLAKVYPDALLGLFEDGQFRQLAEQNQVPVKILSDRTIAVRKESSWLVGLSSLGSLIPLVANVTQLSRDYDLIYANTLKALVVGAFASLIARRPLVFHLHDILSLDHFSRANRRLTVALCNRFASRVIAVSQASLNSFIEAGGRPEIGVKVYNGFQLQDYSDDDPDEKRQHNTAQQLRDRLGLDDRFVIGHFSRLCAWKGQHILIDALTHCPPDVTAVLVGDDLFGEQDYVQELHDQVARLGLSDRVHFLGFRSDVVPLMKMCDLITHTSTTAEPFGRVIVEAMLCGKPIIAADAGGVLEIVEPGVTGWLVPPGDAQRLAETINHCRNYWQETQTIAQQGRQQAKQRFNLTVTRKQIRHLLEQVIAARSPQPGRSLELRQ